MYFASRVQAGRMLANQLSERYADESCAVIALNDGGVVVGVQIAQQLHGIPMLLLSAEIELPREIYALAGITAGGDFAFNEQYSPGEIEEMASEYRIFLEQQKLYKMHELNHLLGEGLTLNKDLLKDQIIILVSDGLRSGFILDLAYQFLKPIAIKKLVVATPFASVRAVDRMHVFADDLVCLNVIEDYTDTDHYYDSKDVPDHTTIIDILENINRNWK
jgi:putative phosphoribosyl transferase